MSETQAPSLKTVSVKLENQAKITLTLENGVLREVSDPLALQHWLGQVLRKHFAKSRKKPNELVVTQKSKRDMRFFSDTYPCWFEGCEELREAYREELEDAGNGNANNCKGCVKGALVRKYLKLVEERQP